MLNSTRLLIIGIWFGSALFFSAVVAPAAFAVLRSFALPNASEIAGGIVNRSLSVVNISGFVVGLFLLITLFAARRSAGRVSLIVEAVCVLLIVLGTAVGHWVIAARIRVIRAALSLPIDQLPLDDSRRIEFNALHGYSVNALGLAMIAALVIMVLLSLRARN
jgi:hypothetical protein